MSTNGHMIYVRPQGLKHLHANIAQFIRSTDHEGIRR